LLYHGDVVQMADIHDCGVIATAGIAKNQKITAAVEPHMTKSYRSELPSPRSWHHHDPIMTLQDQSLTS
jgi:hypothetical protein